MTNGKIRGQEAAYRQLLRAYVERLRKAVIADLYRTDSVSVALENVPVPDPHAIGKATAGAAQRSFQRLVPLAIPPSVAPYIDTWRQRNVHLIRSIAHDLLPEITTILATSETPREDIEKRFDVARSRADLIARDQVLKLNGQITEHLQTSAGVSRYTWSTSHDERVRPDHAELDGTEQEWIAPPLTATGPNHPGQDFSCRCVAIPILPE